MRKYLITLTIALIFLPASLSARTIRLFSIGNSFSEDAVEQFLYELCLEDKDTLIIGNAYQSGYSLKQHWDDVCSQARNIEYCKVIKGKRYIYKNCRLDSLLKDEPWDIITMQQVSQDAGDFPAFEPYLTNLISHIKATAITKDVALGFHMTWAYAQNAKHPGFKKYGNNQMKMYKAIVKTAKKVLKAHRELSFLAPSGTAIQNARTSSIGDNLNRDGFHLNYGIGRYTVACAWSELITGKSCVGKVYYPKDKGIHPSQVILAQRAAHAAVNNPYRITKIK
uniref:DUF4886 domain-containing protein n=1 Tax=Prevotella sp. GTC17253 TaxID=3236793 RepID=A0AB33IR07_9BACT